MRSLCSKVIWPAYGKSNKKCLGHPNRKRRNQDAGIAKARLFAAAVVPSPIPHYPSKFRLHRTRCRRIGLLPAKLGGRWM